MAGMRRSEVSALRWADIVDGTDGDGMLGYDSKLVDTDCFSGLQAACGSEFGSLFHCRFRALFVGWVVTEVTRYAPALACSASSAAPRCLHGLRAPEPCSPVHALASAPSRTRRAHPPAPCDTTSAAPDRTPGHTSVWQSPVERARSKSPPVAVPAARTQRQLLLRHQSYRRLARPPPPAAARCRARLRTAFTPAPRRRRRTPGRRRRAHRAARSTSSAFPVLAAYVAELHDTGHAATPRYAARVFQIGSAESGSTIWPAACGRPANLVVRVPPFDHPK